jgi:hypothetical protein
MAVPQQPTGTTQADTACTFSFLHLSEAAKTIPETAYPNKFAGMSRTSGFDAS